MDLPTRLRMLADWCERHGVRSWIGLNPDCVQIEDEDFARLTADTPTKEAVAPYCYGPTGRWQHHLRATVDGVIVVAVVPCDAPAETLAEAAV